MEVAESFALDVRSLKVKSVPVPNLGATNTLWSGAVNPTGHGKRGSCCFLRPDLPHKRQDLGGEGGF